MFQQKYMKTPIHFDNKGFEFIHLNSILHENDLINCLPESIREHETQLYIAFLYHQE